MIVNTFSGNDPDFLAELRELDDAIKEQAGKARLSDSTAILNGCGRVDIIDELKNVAEDICDHYCKWPDSYDLTKMSEDEATELLDEEHCTNCPILQFMI